MEGGCSTRWRSGSPSTELPRSGSRLRRPREILARAPRKNGGIARELSHPASRRLLAVMTLMQPAEPIVDDVEALLAECLEQAEGERLQALRRMYSSHPSCATALRERWRALAEMGIVDPEPVADGGLFPERLGDFRLLCRLGGGGMGVVYLARQESLGREVALKLIRPEQLFFPGARSRFQREAEAIARLSHPGIVPIHMVGEENGIPFFAMERIAGCTLAEALQRCADRAPESLSGADLHASVCERAGVAVPIADGSPYALGWVDACIAIARQIADALEHAHARGCLHRDVKPSNVMLTPEGRALLVDFGLTSLAGASDRTRTGTQIGTLHYMSPEQIHARGEIGARADVYGLGVTLYEMLTLQLPFQAEDVLQTQRLIFAGRPDAIRPRNRKVSADVETACMVALDVDAGRRYESAASFSRDLSNLLQRRPILARPPGPLLRARRWAQRRPAAAVALVLGTVLVTGLPTALYVQERRNIGTVKETARASAEKLDFVLNEFSRTSASGPDEPVTLLEVLDATTKRADIVFADRPWLAGSLRVSLGKTYLDLHQSAKAAEVLEPALRYFEQHAEVPFQHRHPMEARTFLADAWIDLGEYARAEVLLDQAIAYYRSNDPGPYNKLAYCESLRASVWARTGRPTEAEAYWRRILAASGEVRDSDLARTLAELGQIEVRLGRYPAAQELYESALRIFDESPAVSEEEHLTLIQNVGLTLKMQGRLVEAQPYYERAMSRAAELWQGSSATQGGMLSNYAGLLEAQGRIDEALDAYRAAADMLEDVLGASARPTVIARGNMAGLLMRAGECSEALALYDELLPLQRQVLGASDPIPAHSLHNLSRCAQQNGDLEAAAQLLREALDWLSHCPDADQLAARWGAELGQLERGSVVR